MCYPIYFTLVKLSLARGKIGLSKLIASTQSILIYTLCQVDFAVCFLCEKDDYEREREREREREKEKKKRMKKEREREREKD